MKKLSIFTITSALHDAEKIAVETRRFLGGISIPFDFMADDYASFPSAEFPIIYVRTGGTENEFLKLFDGGIFDNGRVVYLLASNVDNSLAASMEILSFLRMNGREGEIIHGSPERINSRLAQLLSPSNVRLGVIGQPSDWLISSGADYTKFAGRGVELVDIPIDELIENYQNSLRDEPDVPQAFVVAEKNKQCEEYVEGAIRIYNSLKIIVEKYGLSGFTLRCFDLLTSIRNTGCLALAMFNSEGKVAACEGDIPAMLTMMTAYKVTGVFGFQANPSRIDVDRGEVVFAHCTVPLNLVERFSLDTHFESGIGVGIRGALPLGEVTIFKVAADMERVFTAEGRIEENLRESNLCRTQIRVKLDNPAVAIDYFLTNPIGNHHIILPGHVADKLKSYFQS